MCSPSYLLSFAGANEAAGEPSGLRLLAAVALIFGGAFLLLILSIAREFRGQETLPEPGKDKTPNQGDGDQTAS